MDSNDKMSYKTDNVRKALSTVYGQVSSDLGYNELVNQLSAIQAFLFMEYWIFRNEKLQGDIIRNIRRASTNLNEEEYIDLLRILNDDFSVRLAAAIQEST